MHILILDDIQHRHDVFRRIYAGHDVTSALRFFEFVRLLVERRWDLVHLDHDLGDFVADADFYVDGWGSKLPHHPDRKKLDALCQRIVESMI